MHSFVEKINLDTESIGALIMFAVAMILALLRAGMLS